MQGDIFRSILEVFLLFGVGAIVFALKMLEESDVKKLSKLILDIFMPALTFMVIIRNFDVEKLKDSWIMPVVAFGIFAVGGIIGWPLKKLMRHRTPERERTFFHICAINNYIFLPVIIVGNLWGEYEMGLLLLMSVGSTVGFWTLGVWTFTGAANVKLAAKALISPNVVAILLAAIVVFTGINLPSPLTRAIDSLGKIGIPLMIMLVGVILSANAKVLKKHLFDAFYLSLVRLLVIPLACGFLLRLLNLSESMYNVALIVSVMPAATSSVILAQEYDGDVEFCSQMIVLSTLLCLGSIPLMLWFFSL